MDWGSFDRVKILWESRCLFLYTKVPPPFVVLRIVPYSPTTVPLFASVKKTPIKMFVVPLDCENSSLFRRLWF